MREFIYYSKKGRTSGNFKDLMSAGRLDIACHAIISSFFLSNNIREDVKMHLFLNGPPDPPKHIELYYHPEIPISKKDIGGLLKRILFKHKKGRKTEAFPGCFIEKKSMPNFIKELKRRNIYLLDKKGDDLRDIEIGENPVFIIGDQEGIDKKEKRELIKKHNVELVSIGKLDYFASQVISFVNIELDKRQ